MAPLFPMIKPYQVHRLAVDNVHTLYIEEIGNPEGKPIIILHPGPGQGSYATLCRFFDPEDHRIIIFDQRGCGQSLPYGETHQNNTALLIEDIQKIQQYLQVEQVCLCGGGWGGLLALLYAQAYPDAVQGLLIYSVFLGRKEDIQWIYQQGTNTFFPDYWQDFISPLPPDYTGNVITFYSDILKGDNDVARMAAAKQWALWYARASSLHLHKRLLTELTEPHTALALTTLQTHYLHHHFFIKENQILENCSLLQKIPTYIVHGRYDALSPLGNAWQLLKALPHAHLSIVRDGAHSDFEAGLQEAIMAAGKRLNTG